MKISRQRSNGLQQLLTEEMTADTATHTHRHYCRLTSILYLCVKPRCGAIFVKLGICIRLDLQSITTNKLRQIVEELAKKLDISDD